MKNPLLEVTPVVPEALSRLPELASNLFFGWHRPTRALFEDLDRELWKQTVGNPRLHAALREPGGAAAGGRGSGLPAPLRSRCCRPSTPICRRRAPAADAPLTAYFCAEYGFHESFPIYSGGLGVLAGDHCKAASDERMNFVAVGLLYGQGYFTQTVDNDGRAARRIFASTIRATCPSSRCATRRANGSRSACASPSRDVVARVWKAQVGRVPVYLLDTNCAENAPADRDITHRLYGGDQSTRIRQEIVLGIGGARALRKLGLQPAVWHLNEGHAAFLILELLREHLGRGLAVQRGARSRGGAMRVHHAYAGRRRARRFRSRPDHRASRRLHSRARRAARADSRSRARARPRPAFST